MTTLWMAQGQDGRAVSKTLLMTALGVDELPRLEQYPQGKPYLVDVPLHHNLSHSGTLALCALSDSPVGVDIEVVRPRSAGLPKRVLSPRELQWYQERGAQWGDFCTLWTLKEAQVKYLGTGLRRDPRSISVPCLDPGEVANWRGLWYTAYSGDTWRAALCHSVDCDVVLRKTVEL